MIKLVLLVVSIVRNDKSRIIYRKIGWFVSNRYTKSFSSKTKPCIEKLVAISTSPTLKAPYWRNYYQHTKNRMQVSNELYYSLGHFLWFNGSGIAQMWSSRIPRTGSLCELELSLYQVGMNDGAIKLIIITNDTSSIAADKPGNNHAMYVTSFRAE